MGRPIVRAAGYCNAHILAGAATERGSCGHGSGGDGDCLGRAAGGRWGAGALGGGWWIDEGRCVDGR